MTVLIVVDTMITVVGIIMMVVKEEDTMNVEVGVTKAVDVVLDEITMVDVALDDVITMMLHVVVDEIIMDEIITMDVVLDKIIMADEVMYEIITLMLHVP